ncbi:uncharacterized protein LOC141696470 [Apium graveolens]|uniref:uncharacterized protein LOC141696470 n=1 Tax=Apium graveolens TaxID=4045 RepID=UPI003D7AA5C1
MSHQLLGSDGVKNMWETIELLMEGTEEVKENRMDILTTQYEVFKLQPGETLSSLFERYARLSSELKLQGKEQEQRAIIYGPGSIDSKSTTLTKTTTLVACEPETQEVKIAPSSTIKEIIEYESVHGEPEDESEFYTQEELEELEDKSMAYMAAKFSHVRFRGKPNYKSRCSSGRFQKGSYSSGSSSRGGYKSRCIDKSKIRCYNCNELGHFVSDCRNPKAVKGKGSYKKKETYEDLKRQNKKLKHKLNAYVLRKTDENIFLKEKAEMILIRMKRKSM